MIKKHAVSLCLLICVSLILSSTVIAADKETVSTCVYETAAYMLKTVKSPEIGSVGGEWAIIGLARSGVKVDDAYYQNYYSVVEDYVKACGGVLHKKKYTEYSRIILALTAIGKIPADVAGYNLLTALGDYDKTIWQGLNGPIWALIALAAGSYPMPLHKEAATQATRDMYVDRILACQLKDGGFSLYGGTAFASEGDESADTDITAMALQALAKYSYRRDVERVIDEALTCLSKMQDSNGGYSSWGTTNAESVCQVITALGELGIPLDDGRFVKNGNSLIDNLLTYRAERGGFKHIKNGDVNQMASEQAFYAIVSAKRNLDGSNSLYRMTDAISVGESVKSGPKKGEGLESKNSAVLTQAVTRPEVSFSDLPEENPHNNQAAIKALASRSIITGYEDGTFKPENTMTRAEFAAIIVKALGLTAETTTIFNDVSSDSWYCKYVGAAYKYRIVNGKSLTFFDPNGLITKQEAAQMVTSAAKLCGLYKPRDAAAIRDVLSQFTDYLKISDWAKEAMAFCYDNGILDQSDIEAQPLAAISRGDIAQMVYNLLGEANLL
jgi:hypothetical protein